MNKGFFSRVDNKLAIGVIFFTLCYLSINWFLAYLVDIKDINVLGIKTWLEATYPQAPVLWLQMFKEASPTEVLQWTFLAGSLVSTAVYLIIHKRNQIKPSVGWKMAFVGFLLMFLEDTINLRHGTANAIAFVFGQDPSSLAWRLSMWKTAFELSFYLLLSIVMLRFLYDALWDQAHRARTKLILLIGFSLYGIAAFSSATRNIGSWYVKVGERALNFITAGADLAWSADSIIHDVYSMSFWFMDFLVEESLELLGATFLLAAMLMFVSRKQSQLDADNL